MRSLIHRLRTRLIPGDATDADLLAAFLATRDEGAFGEIVRRHGPMVRGVCRRVTANDADADDAAQAVWLVLVRKADAVRPRDRLGSFLYGVAVNVARRARDARIRRQALPLTGEVPGRDRPRDELREVIDAELSGLPDAYRAAVVACDLEGHTRAEAAGRLGWSEGTVASRLARGRALLSERLTRRGLTLPAGLAAVLGTQVEATGAVPSLSALLKHPSPAAEGLAKEVVRAMLTNKLRAVATAALAVVGLVGVGTATVWACGGLRLMPPVSATKPFPLESVGTRDPRPGDATAAWVRPGTAPADAGTEKPGGPGAGDAKDARFVLTNPAGDISVASDRHEGFADFFRRQPVMVARVPADARQKLREGRASGGHVFVSDASFNLDGPRTAAYGASVKLAAVPPGSAAGRLLATATDAEPVIFARDPADKELWHAVGWTRRPAGGFFAATARVAPAPFAPADLIHADKK